MELSYLTSFQDSMNQYKYSIMVLIYYASNMIPDCHLNYLTDFK